MTHQHTKFITMENLQNTIEARLERIERYTYMTMKEVYGLEEASAFTGYSTGQLYRMTSQKEIPHYKKGRKLYFLKSELVGWLTENKVKTDTEMADEAATYIVTHKI